MEKIKERFGEALVLVDVGLRDRGPLAVGFREVDGDLARARSEVSADSILEDYLISSEADVAENMREFSGGGEVCGWKSEAQLVSELLDVVPEGKRENYRRRVSEVECLANAISVARDGFRGRGLPVIFTQRGPVSRIFHPRLKPSGGDKYLRNVSEPSRALVREVSKRVVEGGTVTLAGGFLDECVADAATHLAAADFTVLVPEDLTDARTLSERGDVEGLEDLRGNFIERIGRVEGLLRDEVETSEPFGITVRRLDEQGSVTWKISRGLSTG
ncbi:MAG: hypothetical protein ABH851_01475 [Methanobacteriota archaeon]